MYIYLFIDIILTCILQFYSHVCCKEIWAMRTPILLPSRCSGYQNGLTTAINMDLGISCAMRASALCSMIPQSSYYFPIKSMCISLIRRAKRLIWPRLTIARHWIRRWNCCHTSSVTWRNIWSRQVLTTLPLRVIRYRVCPICIRGSEQRVRSWCTLQMVQFRYFSYQIS